MWYGSREQLPNLSGWTLPSSTAAYRHLRHQALHSLPPHPHLHQRSSSRVCTPTSKLASLLTYRHDMHPVVDNCQDLPSRTASLTYTSTSIPFSKWPQLKYRYTFTRYMHTLFIYVLMTTYSHFNLFDYYRKLGLRSA